MTVPTRVLIVEAVGPDAADHRHLLGVAGHETVQTTDVEQALGYLERMGADVVLVALGHAGLHGVTKLAAAPGGAQVVVLAAESERDDAREALRLGAYDVVRRADAIDSLLFAVDRAVHAGQLLREVATLRARVGDRVAESLVGRSTAMDRVRELVGRAAGSRITVLVTGEAGTGKDLVARLVHDLSDRASRPFVTVRCAGADASMLEAELFGTTGSDERRPRGGLFEQARGGTLVLDGFPDIPHALRVRIAAVLAERAVHRETGSAAGLVPVDVRLILTAREGPERAPLCTSDDDILGRFSVLPIALPPLRERRRDIPTLVHHFRSRLAREGGGELPPVPPDAMLHLVGQGWAGNVRELEHFVERSAYQPLEGAPSRSRGGDDAAFEAGETLDALERRYILHVLDQVDGHQSRAAERLGIDRRTLYRKLKQYAEDRVTSHEN
ncbi:MAG: Sigma-54 dependent response regulator [Gemmatimonadetes bacterium]|jgi:DNA-binding NtrC family response regulator|nr:Sigma-54 dependent response regulator [Gemmatimonadota bacterium]